MAAIPAYIATQTKMESVPMTDPDEHPYINYASAPKYAGVGDYIIQTLMTAASAALQEEARLKPAEAAAAQQAAMAQVLIPADAPDQSERCTR